MNSDQKTFTVLVALVLAIYIFFSLGSNQSKGFDKLQKIEENSTLEILIPVIKTEYKDSTFPIIFEAAYLNGTSVEQGPEKYSFTKTSIGGLKVESGKIVACDPILMFNAEPFVQKFPIGEFPVELALSENSGYQSIAFSRILFSTNPVNRWEYARLPGQQEIPITGSDYYCFSVDGGLAIFIDEEANRKFNSLGQLEWNHVFTDYSEMSDFQAGIHSFNSHNLAKFSSGYGDGCYSTFVGYDSTNQICRLLIDFGLINWWESN